MGDQSKGSVVRYPTAVSYTHLDVYKRQEELHGEMQSSFDQYAEEQPVIRHIVELALLSAGELRGVALQEFIKRTTELLSSK